jgi:hypothetical protein
MASAIEWHDGSITLLDEDDPWADDPTVVIPSEQLERLRDVMEDGDGAITQRLDPVPELLATGSATELPRSERSPRESDARSNRMTPWAPQAVMYEEVRSSPRAAERTVTDAPAADRYPDWLIAMAVMLLAIEIALLTW